MDDSREQDEFRRMAIVAKVDRAEGLIADYWDGINFYRERIREYWYLLGRIGERLGDPEPEEPR